MDGPYINSPKLIARMRLCILLLLIYASPSCKKSRWESGEITNYGTYNNTDLKIKVYEENSYLKYEVRNEKNEVVIKNDDNLSVVHQWGLFVDDDKNVWVFSSDIGDAIWKRDTITGKYAKRVFRDWLTRDSVPDELYASSLKRFLK